MNESYSVQQATTVAQADVQTRADFISRTYMHLLGAILGFIGIEVYLFQAGLAAPIAKALLSVNWLFVMGGFVLISWLASRAAQAATALAVQYFALAAYVVAQAIIFVPLLDIANRYAKGTIESAAVVTLFGLGGLTAVVFITRKDFSFMRGILFWGGIMALVTIVAGAIFGFNLGTFFSIAMIALAGGAILYDTSNVLHHYPTDRHVSAALQLFASVALMFWYVLRLFLGSRR